MNGSKQPSKTAWEEMVRALKRGSSGVEEAIHKPLLVLILLARVQQGASNEVRFNEIGAVLEDGSRRFGSAASPGGSEMPFWHLKNDGFWVVEEEDTLPRRKQGDRPTRTTLREGNAKGYVPLPLWQQLVESPELVDKLARELLGRFPAVSAHPAILQHVGLRLSQGGDGPTP